MPKSAVSGPLITVLVPCFNVEKFVEECIDSILAQTYSNLEVICINDGSTDSTPQILDRYANSDKRIRVISKTNSGYGHSMNVGLDAAKGDYIGIVESDDFIEPDMFEKLLKNAVANDLDISKCGYFEFKTADGTNTPVDTTYVPKNRVLKPVDEQSPFYQPPSIWSAIYKRAFLKRNGIRFLETPGASYQDTSFAFKCYFSADRFGMLEESLLHYRIDNANSSINNPKKLFCVCDEYDEIWRFAQEKADRFEKVKTLVPVLELSAYKWNFNRLKLTLKRVFLKRFHEEFKRLDKAGLIDRSLFTPHDQKILTEAIRIPVLLYFRAQL